MLHEEQTKKVHISDALPNWTMLYTELQVQGLHSRELEHFQIRRLAGHYQHAKQT